MNPTKRVARLALAGLMVLAAGVADAAKLYKLIDRDGRVTYVDALPKKFDGQVIPIDIDSPAAGVPAPEAPKVVPKKAEPPPAAPVPAGDLATRRRETRAALEANVERARRNLEQAKLALANVTMEDDERQVIQRQVDPPPVTKTQMDPKKDPTRARTVPMNCSKAIRDGKTVTVCGAIVPNEKYAAKLAQLEDAVRRAEEQLEEAERAYRRGVD